MERQLVTIQKITKLTPIPNADQIVCADILGWKCVVRKEDFKEGDLCVYMEVDSFLPETPEFEFMKQRKYRVRTIRLKGQVSQGLVMPLSVLKDKKFPNDTRDTPVYDFKEGQDITSMLGVTKWEPPVPAQLMGEAKGVFKDVLPKTDETRVQLLQPLLDKYKGLKCYSTEKVDGSSFTCGLYNREFFVCSRNLELKFEGKNLEDNEFVKMAIALNLEAKLRALCKKEFGGEDKNIALQGELAGLGIQCNRLNLRDKHIFFFNVYDIDNMEYLNYRDFLWIINILQLETVPILGEFELINDIPSLVALASSEKSILNPTKEREGIVIRPVEEIYDNEFSGYLKADRVSFKVINPEYLITHSL